jgi:hypothetical protein
MLSYMYIARHVKYPLFLSDFSETWIFIRSFYKYSNIRFHENPSNGSWAVPCRWMNRCDEANSHFLQLCVTCLKIDIGFPKIPTNFLSMTLKSQFGAKWVQTEFYDPCPLKKMINVWVLLAKQWFNPSRANFSVSAQGELFGEWLISPWNAASEIYWSESVQSLLVENPTGQKVVERWTFAGITNISARAFSYVQEYRRFEVCWEVGGRLKHCQTDRQLSYHTSQRISWSVQRALILVLSLSSVISTRGIQTLSLKMRIKYPWHQIGDLRGYSLGPPYWRYHLTLFWKYDMGSSCC